MATLAVEERTADSIPLAGRLHDWWTELPTGPSHSAPSACTTGSAGFDTDTGAAPISRSTTVDLAESELIAVDGIVFALQRHGGISVYFREILDRLRRDCVPTWLALDGKMQQADLPCGGAVSFAPRQARALERYRHCRVPSSMEPQVFHSSYYRRPSLRSLPTVVTVHDFTYERFVTGPRRWAHSAQKTAAIRAAQTIVCVSQATLDDLNEFVGLRTDQQARVILNGVSDGFRPLDLPPAERPFVLFVGQRGGYKNFALVLRALEHLPDLALCCVGGGALTTAELAAAPDAVRNRVLHAGFVTDDALNRLYNQALCLVYPSRYEGFGIPVAEAMRAGCPVISVPCKAVLEIGGDALSVSPDEPAALASAIDRIATDTVFRAQQVAKGHAMAARFSWEKCYRETRDVYRELGLSG